MEKRIEELNLLNDSLDYIKFITSDDDFFPFVEIPESVYFRWNARSCPM